MTDSPATYTATRRAAIYKEANVRAACDGWVLKGQSVPGRPADLGWVAVERDGIVLGYVKAGALRVVS